MHVVVLTELVFVCGIKNNVSSKKTIGDMKVTDLQLKLADNFDVQLFNYATTFSLICLPSDMSDTVKGMILKRGQKVYQHCLDQPMLSVPQYFSPGL